MPRDSQGRGFSLLEMLITLLVWSIVLLSFFSLLDRVQEGVSGLSLKMEWRSNVALAPLLLSRWLPGAGNNRRGQTWQGVSFQNRYLRIMSDIDGAGGFPDRKLESSFESLALRVRAGQLQVRSGRGSFQSVLRHVSSLELSGTAPLVTVSLGFSPPDSPGSGRAESERLLFFLHNYRPQLFLP